MKKLTLALAAVATLVTSSVVPAMSAPWKPSGLSSPGSNVEQVRYRRGYYYNGGRHYYNGHRGYNYYRPGYRNYNGWWYPAAAFAAGALIGGAIAAQPAPAYPAPSYGAGGVNAHVQWCANRYRSYRVSDNTFQPYGAPRQQCVSPY
ncbi:BA14K family protein [Ancylobacter moscoviensis]